MHGVAALLAAAAVAHLLARALGAQDLEAEKSLNYGIGATLTPGRFNLTVDYYQVEIDDRIVVTENLQGAQVVSLLRAAGFNNITSARFFINGIDTRTRGL
ncbi:MAG: TonB-dependent receptor, partial [Gemmatimonadetes bacterium]|nr:TonB-dependent receptor [Gemmatimonadota bacterium]